MNYLEDFEKLNIRYNKQEESDILDIILCLRAVSPLIYWYREMAFSELVISEPTVLCGFMVVSM